nr:uncharacterized mitochondrial protein AtMg00810-like [Tanacetum cinerariifolium]
MSHLMSFQRWLLNNAVQNPGFKASKYASGQISLGLDLTYAPSTITTQQPTEGELDLLFEAMYDDYICGQSSATARTVPAAQEPQVHQTSTASTSIADTAPTPTNSSSHATNIPITSQDVDELNPNAMVDGNTFVNPFVNSSTSFIDADHPSHVYKLKKTLYGLKQAPRPWYDELSTFLLQNHFFKGTIDPTLFIRRFYDDILVVQVYADDIIFGSTHPRPDIVHATCLCARYQAKPTEKHLKEVKRIFRYIQGTVNTGLWYTKDFGFELTGFFDADYAGCKDSFKSTSGGAQFLEAEYVSLSDCCAQVLWMRTQLTDYGFIFNKIPIYCDSKSAI